MAKVVALKPVHYNGTHAAGTKFEMAEQDIDRHVKVGLVTTAEALESAEEEETDGTLDSSLEALKAAWTVELSPLDYLKQFPEGPYSDLAMSIVEFEAEAETQESVPPISTSSLSSE